MVIMQNMNNFYQCAGYAIFTTKYNFVWHKHLYGVIFSYNKNDQILFLYYETNTKLYQHQNCKYKALWMATKLHYTIIIPMTNANSIQTDSAILANLLLHSKQNPDTMTVNYQRLFENCDRRWIWWFTLYIYTFCTYV